MDRLLALRAAGMSMSRVASELGVSVGKVHEVLRGIQETSSIDPSNFPANVGPL